MMDISKEDLALIEAARDVITRNYDEVKQNHTVGAALRTKDGKIYTGVNVYNIHGACAEQVAIGTAIVQGEREFDSIVAVRGRHGEEVIPPCGNCRQIIFDYMPDCKVILGVDGELKKFTVDELIPHAYVFEGWDTYSK